MIHNRPDPDTADAAAWRAYAFALADGAERDAVACLKGPGAGLTRKERAWLIDEARTVDEPAKRANMAWHLDVPPGDPQRARRLGTAATNGWTRSRTPTPVSIA